ncbi:MAE_28990/MAE_18760 family HEPN-like nuclease [Flavobacterium johnsoniae]|jgi:hypothetical protein|uniref:MAE-28990/MAE-18760-like HEPN domain-containing protein n=1 Tax=Flavobacterium johnsoniae TaxID=986 RepID=A0A1J7BU68_FLAJO|nr:MAE_28990/MAE_18760 family HEPN-like nuclease [Flavobacterium johnsoniae]OIV41188.1 hypothetical protein BKM63_11570 [Flavobacterium johnsoniae]OIV42251.1 hypothetical protein BKM63_11530 [Flavobacterium johnsoniae]
MKLNKLEELLEEDLGWRKKELSDLILIAKQTGEEVVLKSIILLLYAHWEGYIKRSSKLYLNYISDSKKFLNELTENFRAVILKGIINQCIASKEALTLQNELIVLSKLSNADKIKFKIKTGYNNESNELDVENDFDNTIINTHSNLNPKVFKNILSVIGLQYKTQIESREKYIDSHLLANRNSIGHGSRLKKQISEDFALEINDIEKLRDVIFSIIDNFSDELVEYCKEEYFLISNQHKLTSYIELKELELSNTFKYIDEKYS